MTIEQMSIALAKLYTGTVPGDDIWCELDYEALEFALGYQIERRQPRFEAAAVLTHNTEVKPTREAGSA